MVGPAGAAAAVSGASAAKGAASAAGASAVAASGGGVVMASSPDGSGCWSNVFPSILAGADPASLSWSFPQFHDRTGCPGVSLLPGLQNKKIMFNRRLLIFYRGMKDANQNLAFFWQTPIPKILIEKILIYTETTSAFNWRLQNVCCKQNEDCFYIHY